MIHTDIETMVLPNVEEYFSDDMLTPVVPANYTKEETIQKFLAEEPAKIKAKLLEKASLDPDFGRIGVVGFWVEGESVPVILPCRDERDEKEAIQYWSTMVDSHGTAYGHTRMLCGYNILDFDLPFLMRRALYLGVKPPRVMREKYRHGDVLDLKQELCEHGRLPWRSLDFYTRRLGLIMPHGQALKGKDMPALMAAGEFQSAQQHNYDDLALSIQLAVHAGFVDERNWGEALVAILKMASENA